MFSIISNGTVDSCEVLKYKGHIPDWATQFCMITHYRLGDVDWDPTLDEVIEEWGS